MPSEKFTITTSNLPILLSDAPARINEIVAAIIVGRSLAVIESKLRIERDALLQLVELVNASHANARMAFGVTLTAGHRKERAKNVVAAVKKGESIPDVAKRFQISEVHARNYCRKRGVKLQVGRPRNERE